MNKEHFDFSKTFGKRMLERFALVLTEMNNGIGFRVSARGWCYLMEQAGYIDKSQFDKVESAVNRCRKMGLLPVDFVADESARAFTGVEKPNDQTDKPEVKDTLKWILKQVLSGDHYYTPDWWEGEEYYIQMLVEKIDLKSLWTDVTEDYHIPIANAKGWSSILQRAEYARRFKEAEARGLNCVLLYCGDHDPDGLRISDTLRKNLYDVKDIFWSDSTTGYDPTNLIIKRFGLNYDFIIENGYTWIDNLITGSGSELARVVNGKIVPGLIKRKGQQVDKEHQNFKLPYLQNYINQFGVRKCEANAVVTTPETAIQLVIDEIESWVGPDAKERFASKRFAVKAEYEELLDETRLREAIEQVTREDNE